MFCSSQLSFKWKDVDGNTFEDEFPVFGKSCEEVNLKVNQEIHRKRQQAEEYSYRDFECKIGNCTCSSSP